MTKEENLEEVIKAASNTHERIKNMHGNFLRDTFFAIFTEELKKIKNNNDQK